MDSVSTKRRPSIQPGRPQVDQPAPQAPSAEDIAGWLGMLVDPDQVVELRAPKVRAPDSKRRCNLVEHFKAGQLDQMARLALKLSGNGPAIYFALNPVRLPLGKDKDGKPRRGASKDDIISRRRLLIDFDPVRGPDTSSTDEEKAKALEVAEAVRAFLSTLGWPEPILADSGNGYHHLLLIDLPNDEASEVLVKEVLAALGDRFDTAAVKIDRSVYDANRITKLYGTMACKGESTPERPHRYSRVLKVPAVFTHVDRDQLAELVREVKPAGPTTPPPVAPSSRPRPQSDGSPPSGDGTTIALTDRRARAERYLDACEPAVSGQKGHDKLFKVACRIGPGLDLPPEEAFALLRDRYNPRCDPPWTDEELRHKVEDAYRRETRIGHLLEAPPKGADGASLIGHNGAVATGQQSGVGETNGVPPGDGGHDHAPTFRNFRTEKVEQKDGPPKLFKRTIRMDRLERNLREITGGWPRRVGETLFNEGRDHKPVYLDSPPRLFAWIDAKAKVDWASGSSLITQARLFEHLRMNSEQFEAIETLPHWPQIPGIYYMHREVPRPSGKLDQLLDFFSPETEVDRELIRAMVLTFFWGGEPGTRPIFLITGPDQDPKRGRGLGKSTLIEVLAHELAGGLFEVSPNDSFDALKTRLLSPDALQTRVARIDNLKALRFSWGELEGQITAKKINGHALYKGDGSRPNTLVWCITLNGPSFSSDLAQRTVQIKLRRPKFTRTWSDDVQAFAKKFRWEIIADIRAILEAPQGTGDAGSRWGSWEAGVVSKLRLANECLSTIMARQEVLDSDDEEKDLVAEQFRGELLLRRYEPDSTKVFIKSGTAADWLMKATGMKYPVNKASSHLKELGIPELRESKKNGARGFIWEGTEAAKEATADFLQEPPIGDPSVPAF